jgi:hypothetical protein
VPLVRKFLSWKTHYLLKISCTINQAFWKIDDAYNFDDEFAENPLLNQPVNQENHQVSFEKRTSEEIRVSAYLTVYYICNL